MKILSTRSGGEREGNNSFSQVTLEALAANLHGYNVTIIYGYQNNLNVFCLNIETKCIRQVHSQFRVLGIIKSVIFY